MKRSRAPHYHSHPFPLKTQPEFSIKNVKESLHEMTAKKMLEKMLEIAQLIKDRKSGDYIRKNSSKLTSRIYDAKSLYRGSLRKEYQLFDEEVTPLYRNKNSSEDQRLVNGIFYLALASIQSDDVTISKIKKNLAALREHTAPLYRELINFKKGLSIFLRHKSSEQIATTYVLYARRFLVYILDSHIQLRYSSLENFEYRLRWIVMTAAQVYEISYQPRKARKYYQIPFSQASHCYQNTLSNLIGDFYETIYVEMRSNIRKNTKRDLNLVEAQENMLQIFILFRERLKESRGPTKRILYANKELVIKSIPEKNELKRYLEATFVPFINTFKNKNINISDI